MVFQPLTDLDVPAPVKYAVGQQLEIAVKIKGHSFVDNLISARRVLANGEVIELSKTSNPKLF